MTIHLHNFSSIAVSSGINQMHFSHFTMRVTSHITHMDSMAQMKKFQFAQLVFFSSDPGWPLQPQVPMWFFSPFVCLFALAFWRLYFESLCICLCYLTHLDIYHSFSEYACKLSFGDTFSLEVVILLNVLNGLNYTVHLDISHFPPLSLKKHNKIRGYCIPKFSKF